MCIMHGYVCALCLRVCQVVLLWLLRPVISKPHKIQEEIYDLKHVNMLN